VKVSSDKGFAVFCFGRVLVGLKIFEGKEILKINFSGGRGGSSFANFGLRVGL